MPSFDHGSFDGASLLPLGGILNARSEPLEIRGVYGGRKKRYIVERQESSACCKEKAVCLPSLGQILKDCKCQKCPTGFPALGGTSCQDSCPEGQEKNDKGGCCPNGQKAKEKGDGCEPKLPDNDRKGGCPGNTVLDPKQGWDPKPMDPKCQIDDEKDCPKPKVPATRPDGSENDASYKVGCGEVDKDESKRPKCDPKSQYVHTEVREGKATQECKQTRKYYDRKREKPTNKDLRAKFKDQWNKLKPEYDKKNKEREENLKKLKNIQAEREKHWKDENRKLEEKQDKKKVRQSKCGTVVSLLLGVAYNAANTKRDGEHPYDWTTDYFDEEFVASDDRLKDWPDEVDVDKISEDVDEDAFMKKWDGMIEDKKRIGHSCQFTRKRSLDARCSQRRSLEDELLTDVHLGGRSDNTSSLLERHHRPNHHLDMYPDSLVELDPRNPVVGLIFEILGLFGTRVAVQLIARTTASIAAHAPRLASLAQNPARLFQTAVRGQGAKGGQQAMQSAKQAIMKDKNRWVKCLKDGLPL
ncbi:hypothetical protein CC86DRAFT_296063 [Ophiobolus disseminans]|uniref:Uncharacterized protein n=1 Tax=Ophiobolus disseminans TaxID=1469910 RepID=A0A6A6ZV22_9PLEO|nr:hypothetical protein CC86DRAFT_296063 [Ophiobolus disseminans]